MGIEWEYLGDQALPPGKIAPQHVETWRTPVPGGWLVLVIQKSGQISGLSTTFYPDPQHEWDGSTLR